MAYASSSASGSRKRQRREGRLLPYLSLFGIFAVGAIIVAIKAPTRYRAIMVVSALVLAVMIGFRREVGSDWWNYLRIFELIDRDGLKLVLARGTEPGYVLLNWLATQLGWGIWFPNFVCAAILTWGIVAFSRQQSNPLLAIAIGVPYLVIGVGMAYTRQSAAVGLAMLAIVEYLRGRRLRMLVFLVVAATFHVSSVVMLPLLGIAAARRAVVTSMLALGAAVILYLQFSGRVAAKLDFYSAHTFGSTGAIPRLAMNVLPALLYLSFRQRFTKDPLAMRLWSIFALSAVALMLLLFFVDATVIADRVGIYLIPMQIFVLSNLPVAGGSVTRPSVLITSGVLAYSLTIQLAWMSFGSWGHAWLPYRNYLWSEATEESPPVWFRRAR